MISALKGPGEVAAEIIMTRQLFKGTFLVVEGDDDSRFWRSRIDTKACEIIISGGKPAAIGGILHLDNQSFSGVLGIIDDDFDSLESRTPPSPNLITTDSHDLETLLFQTKAFEKLLAEYGDPSSIEKIEKKEGLPVREALLQRGIPFGHLRWLSHKNNNNIDFKPLSPWRFINKKTWLTDTDALHQATCDQGAWTDITTLRNSISQLPQPVDHWNMCQGHDLIDIIAIGLSGTLGKSTPGRDKVATLLRAAVELTELAKTKLWASISAWEYQNTPFKVLKI